MIIQCQRTFLTQIFFFGIIFPETEIFTFIGLCVNQPFLTFLKPKLKLFVVFFRILY